MKLQEIPTKDQNIQKVQDDGPDHNESQIDTKKSLPDGHRIVQSVMAEIKEGFDVKMQGLPQISLTFENLSVWAKVKVSKGFCKAGN